MMKLRTMSGLALAAAVLPAAFTAPVRAQMGTMSQEECRCVDPEGNEIENCRCFRVMAPGEFAWSVTPFSDSRARIGITLSTDPGEADARGAQVQEVLEDGPAGRGGIQEGDVITHINGHSLLSPLDDQEAEAELDLDQSMPSQRLLYLARNLEPGDEAEIRYLRDGEAATTTIEAEDLGDRFGGVWVFGRDFEGRFNPEEFREQWEHLHELPERGAFRFSIPDVEADVQLWSEGEKPRILFRRHEGGEPRVLTIEPEGRRLEVIREGWLGSRDYFNTCPESSEERNLLVMGEQCLGGIRMEKLNSQLGEYFGTETGILVADVHPESKLGLQAGDVILRVGDREVTDPARLRRILRSYDPDEEVTLRVMRHKEQVTVTGTLGR